MATIRAFRQRVQNLNVAEKATQAVTETADQISSLNTEQMHRGLNSEGRPIGEYKLPAYAEAKHRMNPLPGFGVPDLKVTGAFYEGIFTGVEGLKVETDSVDSKTERLKELFGEVIFGLSDNYKSEYIREFLRPEFVGAIKKELQL